MVDRRHSGNSANPRERRKMSFPRRMVLAILLMVAIQLTFGLFRPIIPFSSEFWVAWLIAATFTIAILLGVDAMSRPARVKLPHPTSYDNTAFTMDSHNLVLKSYEKEDDPAFVTPELATQKATLTMLRALYQQQYEIEEQRLFEMRNR